MLCSGCGRAEALEASEEGLCESCFLRRFEVRVRRNIRRHGMLEKDDRVGVAFSGGKDSGSVLYILNKVIERMPKAQLIAITLKLGIGRDEYVSYAEKFCEKLEVEHHVFSFEEGFGVRLDAIVERLNSGVGSPCSYCGVLKRSLLNKKARELGLTKLAMGHNLDDEVQTALMNLLRGETEKLLRIGPVTSFVEDERFIPRIRPLRVCSEKEVVLYSQLLERRKGLSFYREKCPHSAGAFRHTAKLLLDLAEERHTGIKRQFLASLDRLAERLRATQPEVLVLEKCELCGEPTSRRVCKACEVLEAISED